jgi:uncharacterized protein YbbK (DUF523 family)
MALALRPVVVISRCIDFDSCRYNGAVIRASLREKLEPLVELRPICPELEIGLGVPRDPVNLLHGGGRVRMVQPSTGRDLTDAMDAFAERFLGSLEAVDGFVLKARSPSCGVSDARIGEAGAGPGLFAARVLERFPAVPVEDEARLLDAAVREEFLARVFARASKRLEEDAPLSSEPHSHH